MVGTKEGHNLDSIVDICFQFDLKEVVPGRLVVRIIKFQIMINSLLDISIILVKSLPFYLNWRMAKLQS